MHYYQFHIGDYKSHTYHLTLIQDIAFRRLLDRYYLNEQPLDKIHIARQIGMLEHQDDVLVVLEEFFVLTEQGYINNRANQEIKDFQNYLSKQKINALKGGRPKASGILRQINPIESIGLTVANPKETRGLNVANPNETQNNPNHKPISINQEESHSNNDSEDKEEFIEYLKPSKYGITAIAMKAGGISLVSPGHPELIALVDAGLLPDQFELAARLAVGKGKGFPYALGILRGQLREANQITEAGLKIPEKAWDHDRQTIEAEGKRLGLGSWDEQKFHSGQGIAFAGYIQQIEKSRCNLFVN